MMKENKRQSGQERRKNILERLKNAEEPLAGKVLADEMHVSRQVIVTDIALLKTKEHPIIGTNRGYLYVDETADQDLFRKVIVCKHDANETRQELEAIVDCGVTVRDTIIEHPFYGELTGSLMLKSRYDVDRFMEVIENEEAALLSHLTDGVHLHTIEADLEEKIDAACRRLAELGILVEN